MRHKKDDEGDSYEKNDGGGQTSPHLLLPLHLTCDAVCGEDDEGGEGGEGGDLCPRNADLKAIFALLVLVS